MPKYLIVRFSSIGDMVLTTPVVRCLKKQVEGAEVHYLTKSQYKGIVENNPYIDKVHVLGDSLNQLVETLKYEHFDYLIDLHHNLRTARIKNKLRLLSFSFNKLNLEKWLMVNFKKNKLPDRHIVDRYLDTVKLFDIENDQQGLDYFIPAQDEINVKNLPKEFHKGYVALVIGAKHTTKMLPVPKLVALVNTIKSTVMLLGGKEDTERANEIAKGANGTCYNACGKYNLNQSASLLKQASVVITHDTGLMHIAAAFQKIIFSVWGNTIPEFGMYPYLPHKDSVIIENKSVPCRPCTKIGFSKCPKKHFHCMEKIDVADLGSKINRRMESL